MNDTTIVFGIGAQKSGSSWLHDYLYSHPDCHLRLQKELHYFDSLDGVLRNYTKSQRARMDNLAARRAKPKPTDVDNRAALERKAFDTESWSKIFDGKTRIDKEYLSYLNYGRKDEGVIGEVTPTYSNVSEDRLRHMVSMGPKTKFIYLLRDPLDRAWSQIRMYARRHTNTEDQFEKRAFRGMDKFLAGNAPEVDKRSNYAGALARLQNIVPPTDLMVAFYEDLFSDKTVRRITDFLEIEPHAANMEKVVYKGKSLKLDAGRQKAAFEILEPHYEVCAELFAGEIPGRWSARRNLHSAAGPSAKPENPFG